jgi:trigger factor
MKVQVEDVSPIERKLTIEVEPTQVNQELNRAYATLSRQVKIAGFRPGKVPRRILEQRFKQQVEDDVIRRVVERAYLEAIREHRVEAVSYPRVTNEGLKPDGPFRFQARVDVKPKVEPQSYKELPLKRLETKVEDSQVDQQLEKMRQAMSRLEPVEGREVAEREDFALVDYQATRDGKPFPGSSAENITVEVARGELVESKVAALEGVRVGETKEFDYIFPQDYTVQEVRGQTARFRMHLKGLKTKVVPELNDDFAKEVQGGLTLEELKTKVRGDLEKAARRDAAAKEREEILKLLIDRNPFEVPNAMIDNAVEMMLEGAIRSMARSGVDPRQLSLDFDQLRREMRPRATLEVKGQLLLEAIAEKEGLKISEGEVEKKMEEISKETGQHVAKVRKAFKEPAERRGLERRLGEEKTVEFLKAAAKYL